MCSRLVAQPGKERQSGVELLGWFRAAVLGTALLGCARAGAGATGEPLPAWGERVQLASGEAHRGPWRMNESDYRWVDDPTVALSPSGEVTVAWVDHVRKDVLVQRCAAEAARGCGAPMNVSLSPQTFSWLPRLSVPAHAPQRVYLLWQEIIFSGGSHGGEILFATSRDAGVTFSAPLNLSNSKAGDGKGRLDASTWDNGSLDVLAGAADQLYVAWTEYDGALWFRRSMDAGNTFQPPLRLAGGQSSPARAPSIALGRGNAVYVAWALGESSEADIHFSASSDGGASFGFARAVVPGPGRSDAPKLAVSADDTLHLVHAESTSPGSATSCIRYARRRPGAPGFDAARCLTGSESRSGEVGKYPQLAVDASGAVYVLWERYLEGADRARGLVLSSSNNTFGHFGMPISVPGISGPELGDNGSQQGMLTRKLAVTPGGSIAVVNSTFKAGDASHIWLLRGTLGPAAALKAP